jgi:hypothetical protein
LGRSRDEVGCLSLLYPAHLIQLRSPT